MKIKYSFVCKAANISREGNMNVLGIFNNINAENFPTRFGSFVYVACIEFQNTELGNHNFSVNFISGEGELILPPLEGNIFVNETNLFPNIILEIENIILNKPGIYTINLTIDNQHQVTESINVNHNSFKQERGLIS